MIFRLSRTPAFARGVPLPRGATSSLGNYRLENLNYVYDYPIYAFEPVDSKGHIDLDHDHCFLGEVRDDRPATVHRLNRIREGAPVNVRLRPLTAKPDGRPKYGRALLLQPRMRVMKVTPSGPVRFNKVTSRAALRALKRIGCSATILDYAL